MKQESLLDLITVETSNEKEQVVLDFSQSVGDPMVEIGRLGLIEFCGKDKFESFEELEQEVKKLFNIYVFKPTKTLNQIFSFNSKFTHNSTSKNLNERFRQAIEQYNDLIKESKDGYCLACGKKDNLCSVSKTILPLTTGNSNANFTSNFSNQFLVCKECMASLFFAPINMQKTSGRMGFMISNNHEINKFWSEGNIEIFNANIVKNVDSLVDSKINIFENFIYKTIEELQEENIFGDITFYLISNTDKGSEVTLIHVMENQMNFIYHVAPKFFKDALPTKDKDEWNYLIFKHSSKERKDDGKKVAFEDEVIKNKDYKSTMKYFNPLIKNFIQGKSILYFFKKNHASWHLTQIYLKEIQGMREERLIVLKKVADGLVKLYPNDDTAFYKKVVDKLQTTKNQNEFREQLRIFMRKLMLLDGSKLFSTDEMVFQILPSGENWAETKDILLIALYEKLTINDEIKEEIEKYINNEGDIEDE